MGAVYRRKGLGSNMEIRQLSAQWLAGDEDLSQPFAIRLRVFCDEQGYAPDMELDDTDKRARHLLLSADGIPVGTGRLYWKTKDTVALGRIAVLKDYRGCHLGQRIVEEMVAETCRMGAKRAELTPSAARRAFIESWAFLSAGRSIWTDMHLIF